MLQDKRNGDIAPGRPGNQGKNHRLSLALHTWLRGVLSTQNARDALAEREDHGRNG